MAAVTPQNWSNYVDLAIKEETLYAAYDKIDIVGPVAEEQLDNVDSVTEQQSDIVGPMVEVITPFEPLKCPKCPFETNDRGHLSLHLQSERLCS